MSTHPPSEREGRIYRFSRTERLVHRTTGWLMLLCAAAAACLYVAPLAQLVGRRHLVVIVHEYSGTLLPLPSLLGLASPAFRADLRRLNRFAVYDKTWMLSVRKGLTWPAARPAGKFNAGQKIYAGWIAGAVLIMMFTGLLMWFTRVLPVLPRSSAIFVHDFLALAIGVVLIGHMRLAYRDPEARRGMRTGFVRRAWARGEHSKWAEENYPDELNPPGDPGSTRSLTSLLRARARR
ncbi:cytochrome b/b6 domain-containing protein [Streptomyces sp. NPDC005096]|uniref:cytochrome b/b6 domain-containing protein n=1 Tax=Streptomyces sp. NPDC005096 TaxID=3154559 RepID=UPI0033BCCB8D